MNSSLCWCIQWSPQDMQAHHRNSGNQKFQSHYQLLHSISYCCCWRPLHWNGFFVWNSGNTILCSQRAPNEEGLSMNETTSCDFVEECHLPMKGIYKFYFRHSEQKIIYVSNFWTTFLSHSAVADEATSRYYSTVDGQKHRCTAL